MKTYKNLKKSKMKTLKILLTILTVLLLSLQFISSLPNTTGESILESDFNVENEFEIELNLETTIPYNSWYNNSEEQITIDNAATGVDAHNWTWARQQEWCRVGDGSSETPYLIENITIDCEGTGTGIHIKNSQNVNFTIRNVTISHSGVYPDSGIILESVSYFIIENVNISNNAGLGIYINGNPNHHGIIRNSTFWNNEHGIMSINFNDNEISYNDFRNNNGQGIQISDAGQSGANWIHHNSFINNAHGVSLSSAIFLWGALSKNNIIEDNFLDLNKQGIHFRASGIANNIIRRNTIQNCTQEAIAYTSGAGPNIFYHNNIINTTGMAGTVAGDVWDNGYPSGGNYWDTYSGVDSNHGVAQDIAGADGIGDTAYPVTGGGQDNYPLMRIVLPNATTIITPTQTITYDNITVQWAAVDSASSYNVYVGGVLNETTNDIEQKVMLHVNGTYIITVTTLNLLGESEPSVSITITVEISPVLPNAPTIITPTQTIIFDNITVQWEAVDSASSYNVYVDGVLNKTTSDIEQKVMLHINGTYVITVTTLNLLGESESSVPITIIVAIPPIVNDNDGIPGFNYLSIILISAFAVGILMLRTKRRIS